MLTSQSIFKASVLAEQFDARGIIVQALGGSPLHHMVAASNIGTDMAFQSDTGEVTIDFFRIEQTANAKEGIFDQARHNYALADFVNVGATAVRKALYVARTHVAPRINELVELITMRLASAPISALSKLRITEEEDCPAIYGPNLRKLVDQYAAYHNTEPALCVSGPELSTGEILKLVETGVDSIDQELVPWAAALPEDVLQSVYRNFFTIRNAGGDSRGYFGRINQSVVSMVLVWAIARHLLEGDEVLEGVTTGLKEYRDALTALMAQSAHLICIRMETNDGAIRNGNMVRSITGTEIRVFPPVYREWLKNGGNTDILYGMATSGDQKFTINAISEKADKYLTAWNNYATLATARDSMARMNFLREQLLMSYENILNKPNEDGVLPDGASVRAEMTNFRAVLSSMSVNDADDLHGMCLKLVCRASFANGPSEIILTKMDEEIRKNPKLSPREAGALAVIWYISSWVSSLLVLDNA